MTIQGLVRLDGVPVEGAVVWAAAPSRARLSAADIVSVTTDASGGFSLVTRAYAEMRLLARHAEAPIVSIAVPDDVRDASPPLVIDLVRGVDLSGVVINSRGDPIEGVQVIATGGSAEPGMATGALFVGSRSQQRAHSGSCRPIRRSGWRVRLVAPRAVGPGDPRPAGPPGFGARSVAVASSPRQCARLRARDSRRDARPVLHSRSLHGSSRNRRRLALFACCSRHRTACLPGP